MAEERLRVGIEVDHSDFRPYSFRQAYYFDIGDIIDASARNYGIDSLSEPERHFHNAFFAMGALENGRIGYFYQCGFDFEVVAKSFDVIGIGDAADALRRGGTIVDWPSAFNDQGDYEIPDELDDEYHDLNHIIWDADLEGAAVNYVSANRASFSRLRVAEIFAKYGPDVYRMKQLSTEEVIILTVCWALCHYRGFSIYVSNFADYSYIIGALDAIDDHVSAAIWSKALNMLPPSVRGDPRAARAFLDSDFPRISSQFHDLDSQFQRRMKTTTAMLFSYIRKYPPSGSIFSRDELPLSRRD
jgi:hypothetical protein